MQTTTLGRVGPAARKRLTSLTRPLAALGLLLATAGAAQAKAPSCFACKGSPQTYTVPVGVTRPQVVATGASGATSGNATMTTPSGTSNGVAPAAATATPVVLTPANNSYTNRDITLSGTAPANSTVKLYLSYLDFGATTVITTTATSAGTFSEGPFQIIEGRTQLYATAQSTGETVSANSNTNTFVVDRTAPRVTLSSANGGSGTVTSTSPLTFTATFSEAVTSLMASGLAVTNGTVTSGPTAGSGNTYTFQVTPTTSGTATTVMVRGGAVNDLAGNGNTASSTYTLTYVQPATSTPVVTAPANNSTTNGSPTFAGTAPAGSIVTLYLAMGSGTTQAIGTTTATGGSFSFTPANALTSGTYQVYATAQSSGSSVSANSTTNTFTVDATPPTVVSFVRQSPTAAFTNATAVTYRLTFSESVRNVRTGLNVVTTGSVGITTLSLMAISASVYDVTLSGIAGNGTLNLTLSAQSGLADLVGNLYIGGAVNGPLYTIDQAAPTATVSTTAGSSTSASPIPFSVSFSEPVTGFAASGLSVTNGTVTAGSLSGSGSGPYTFTVTPTGNGPVTVRVAANAVQDAVGNDNTASNALSVQYTAPVAAGLSVRYQTGDFGQPTDGQVRPFLQLVNAGPTAVPYASLTVRYWLTPENFMGQLVTPIDYAKLGTSFVSARYVQLATPRQGAFGYIEYSFSAAAGNLNPGTDSGPIYGKAYKPDYSNLDETDDWSYQTSSSFTTNSHVTVYQNGTLIDGTEPSAVTATTALNVFSASRDASASTQYVSVQLQVRNTGNVPVNYGDLKVRYYFTRDGATSIVPQLDYAKLGNSNISLRVVNLPAPVNGADAYLEIGFSAALGVFYPRTSTDDILFKLRKDNYSTFDQSNDYSFSSTTSLTLNNRITALASNRLVFGTPPAGTPAIVAPTDQPTSARASADAEAASIVAASNGSAQALTASPNPFGEQLTLRFALPAAQAYTLAVYDAQGRLVQQLAHGQAEAEQAQEVAVPTHTYAAGLYLVRLTTATGAQQLKLLKQ